MNNELLTNLQSSQQELEPQFKALRAATAALKTAIRLAGEEKADALPMQKALAKLQEASDRLDDGELSQATAAFQAETEKALDGLAFDFAKNLKDTFEARDISVQGRPPTLVIDPLVLNININARKAQWFYGKEALTRPLPLSIGAIIKAYDQQDKLIMQRSIDTKAFLDELKSTWEQLLKERTKRPQGDRINLIELYSKLVLNRQANRFWNAPSRSTFKDYERPFFVRDLVLAQQSPAFDKYNLRLGVASKSQAESASRSIWLPRGALEGAFYSDIVFEGK